MNVHPLRQGADAPSEPPFCGRHWTLWTTIGALITTWIATAITIGIYVGGIRSDLTNLMNDWARDRGANEHRLEQLMTTMETMTSAVSELKAEEDATRAALAQERQDRLNHELYGAKGWRPQ